MKIKKKTRKRIQKALGFSKKAVKASYKTGLWIQRGTENYIKNLNEVIKN